MRLPRMTTRRWMVVVAIMAVLIGAGLEFARLADYHSNVASERLASLVVFRGSPGPARYLRRERALMLHPGGLERKYDRGARFPWLPVAPDPSEPKRIPWLILDDLRPFTGPKR